MTAEGARRKTSLVIPAYNEEARLAQLFAVLADEVERDLAAAGLDYFEAVVVDDGSTDATSGLLAAAAASDERIRPVIGRSHHRGKGAAIRDGVAVARGEMVLLVDVDLSTPLSDVGELGRRLAESGASVAIGSRDLPGSRVEAPLHRRVLGALFNLAVRIATGLRYTDTQCGFKLLETDVARRLLADQIAEGFAFDVELLLRARLGGVEVVEVPVSYVHDDRSKVRVPGASLAMTRDLARMSWRLRRSGRRARRTPRRAGADPS
ncbi:MAG: glycosyltransferase [Solirubrobacterales bacterium]